MPIPSDIYLTIFLAGITLLPRLVSPEFWQCARNGADLVVFEAKTL